ncbi:hypothetical protein IFM89_009197 [Coptis chinensis]|uniref:Uncharacterized protein n=1 Tax=Coptis chinensis TaxID=261450 RepID=A0A835IV78_9MAGN|nr:hypothetical protein IFM89_009197 [Coptis chinensis]
MFGEVEVPAEVLANNVIQCHAPHHKVGRIPFYVTCSNKVSCSEVREFEFRASRTQDFMMTYPNSVGTSDMLLNIRFQNLLSLGSVCHTGSVEIDGENYHRSGSIRLMMKEDDEGFLMVNTTMGGFYPEKEKEQVLKEKLNSWLIQKVTEDVADGVNINFRDVNGWTALHWAAFCGRERTVGLFVPLDAASRAFTNPTPKFPSCRTPADLAYMNGYKGIAGYLAKSSLTIHLSSLTMKDTKDDIPADITEVEASQKVPDQNASQLFDVGVPDASLKDSLTVVRNATQVVAHIHQVYRIQSFQRK